MGRRQPKQIKKAVIESHEDSSSDSETEPNQSYDSATGAIDDTKRQVVESLASTKKRKKREDLRLGCNNRRVEPDVEYPVPKRYLAFCCFRCTCSDARKRLIPTDESKWIQPADNCLIHRRCCHKVLEISNRWLCPLQRAVRKAEPAEDEWDKLDSPPVPEATVVAYDEVKTKYENEKNMESESFNNDGLAGQDAILNSNIDYIETRKKFVKWAKKHPNREAAVVLNMFGGIGSAIVAMKRLKIAIKTIIHVEHDKVATTVYRWNHDPFEGQKSVPTHANAEINHFYYKNFHKFLDDVKQGRLDTHIDVIIGAPPASDFAGINPKRSGVHGQQGSLILEFAELIVKLEKAQDRPLYYLIGNTIIRNQSMKGYKEGDLEQIQSKLDRTWSVTFDASDVSPCRRRSTFFMNFPFEFTNYEKGVKISAGSCLADGYQYPGRIFEGENGIVSKAKTLMPYLDSLDDERMMVFKRFGDEKLKRSKFLKRPIRISEREAMMGLPKSYVIEPVHDLFTQIMHNGFGDGRIYEGDEYEKNYWKYALPKYYHRFRGNYHGFDEDCPPFKFHSVVGQPVAVKLAPPQTSKTVLHYKEDQYAKRLIGNAFSIPVLEEILKPLKKVFAEKTYPGYDYEYAWESSNFQTSATKVSRI